MSSIFETRLVSVGDYQDAIISIKDNDFTKLKYDSDKNVVFAITEDSDIPVGKLSVPASRMFQKEKKILKANVDWVKQIKQGNEKLWEVKVSFHYELTTKEKETLTLKKVGFIPNFKFRITGTTFKNEDGAKRQELLRRARSLVTATETVPCKLIPDLENAYDPNAVAVKIGTAKTGRGFVESFVGFVPAKLAPIIKNLVEGQQENGEPHNFIYAVNWIANSGAGTNYGCEVGCQIPEKYLKELNELIKEK